MTIKSLTQRALPRRLALGVVLMMAATACAGADSATSSVDQPTTTEVAAPTTTAPSTTTIPPTTTTTTMAFPPRLPTSGLFTFDSPSEVIPNGPDGAWDWQFTDPGAVFVDDDGVIHALQNGFVRWPAPVGVGYWRSEDAGRTWVEVSEDPVFDGTELPYVGIAALASSLIVTDDGTWVLYFYTWDRAGWPAGPSTIGRATAPGPAGPWTADEQPVMLPGSEDEWDAFYVRSPSVIYEDGEYTMFFEGGVREQAMIGMAQSSDGITWTKYDDPTTTAAPFAESDPVLVPATSSEGNVWDQRNVYQPQVVKVDGVYVMSYASSSTVSDGFTLLREIGLATSRDGFDWTRSSGRIVTERGVTNATNVWFTELVELDGELLLFVEVQVGNETSVHLARASTDSVINFPE